MESSASLGGHSLSTPASGLDKASVAASIIGIALLATGLAWAARRRDRDTFLAREKELLEAIEEQMRRLASSEQEIARQKQLRQEERAGRIALETGKRKQKQTVQKSSSSLQLQVIGHIRSPFPDRRGTPRQPQLVPAATGLIVFDRQLIQHAHFAELAQFSHIWVIFSFHENTNDSGDQSKAKIRPPRLHGQSVGCLSTRSPHRPNAIGLSVCEVVEVTEAGITVRSIDMVDGTPILDVKPYIPYDLVASDHELPMACNMDGSPLQSTKLRVPGWIVDWDIPMRQVSFSAGSLDQLAAIAQQGGLRLCRDTAHCQELITQVLRQDIRGIAQRSQDAQEVYMCNLDSISIQFVTKPTAIEVVSIDRAS